MEGYEKNTFYHYGHAKVPLTRAVILFSTIVISLFLQCTLSETPTRGGGSQNIGI